MATFDQAFSSHISHLVLIALSTKTKDLKILDAVKVEYVF